MSELQTNAQAAGDTPVQALINITNRQADGASDVSGTSPAPEPLYRTSTAVASRMEGMNKALIYQPSRYAVAETTVTNATASKQTTDKQTLGEMTDDIMYERLSTWFSDKKNTAFSSSYTDKWHPLHDFIQATFDVHREKATAMFHKAYHDPFGVGDEIKKLTKYVQVCGVPCQLYDEGGSGYTPVMTKSGLQTFLKMLPNTGKYAQERKVAKKQIKRFIAGVILMPNERVDEVMPRPVRQKMVASQCTFKSTEAGSRAASGSSALSVASAASAASTMQTTDEDLAWALCNMEQQSRSNATNASDATNATNATNHQAADKTACIKAAHIFGLLALNPGPPSPCSSFSTPSVADSVEFTETKPEALAGLGLGIDAIEQKAPGNAVMNDTESESEIEEISAGVASSVQLKQKAPGDSGMPDAADESQIDEISMGGNFDLFMAQSAPVQHRFIDKVEAMITRNPIRCEIAHDGKKVSSMSEFVNVMYERNKYEKFGKDIVSKILNNDSPHKAYLENLGIYKLKNARGPATPAMTFLGLKGLLSKLNCNVADEYTNYCSETTTRVEAGDSNMKQVIDANAASSNVYNAMARDAVAQERAAGGPSIAAPPEQVPIAQGAPDVGFKRKADEDNQIYDWQQDERAYEVQVKQWQRNNDTRTKIVAGAEAAVVKTKGVAESKVIAAGVDIKKAEAFVMRTDANANAIKIEADAKKTEAEAKKIEAETALLHFELDQKRKAAGNGAGAKQSETEEEKERRLTMNRKRRESRAQAKAAHDPPPTPPKGGF